MKKFRFQKFQVYKDSIEFRKHIKITINSKFPKEERYSLYSQLSRALNSVILNIAEGSARNSDKDFSHYLNISLSSINEVVACFDIALSEKYINQAEYDAFTKAAEKISDEHAQRW